MLKCEKWYIPLPEPFRLELHTSRDRQIHTITQTDEHRHHKNAITTLNESKRREATTERDSVGYALTSAVTEEG